MKPSHSIISRNVFFCSTSNDVVQVLSKAPRSKLAFLVQESTMVLLFQLLSFTLNPGLASMWKNSPIFHMIPSPYLIGSFYTTQNPIFCIEESASMKAIGFVRYRTGVQIAFSFRAFFIEVLLSTIGNSFLYKVWRLMWQWWKPTWLYFTTAFCKHITLEFSFSWPLRNASFPDYQLWSPTQATT